MQLAPLMGSDCTFALFPSSILLCPDVMTLFNYQYILISYYLLFLIESSFFSFNLLIILFQVRYIPRADQGCYVQCLQVVSPRISNLRCNIGSFPVCLEFFNFFFGRVLENTSDNQSLSPKGTWSGLSIVVGNNFLLIGCHSDSCIPSCFVRPIQTSFKFLNFISLALDGHSGCGHAYLHQDNCIHPIGESKESSFSSSSGCCSIGP